jgi:hypothetical protein
MIHAASKYKNKTFAVSPGGVRAHITYIPTPPPTFFWRHSAATWVYDDKMWIGGGATGSTSQYDVWSTTDGVTWTRSSLDLNFVRRHGASTWVHDDEMWLGGGYSSTEPGFLRSLRNSSDGAEWDTPTITGTPWAGRSYACQWVYGGYIWVSSGRGDLVSPYYYLKNDVYRSSDGIAWTRILDNKYTRIPSTHFEPLWGACSWVYDGKMWKGAGLDSASSFSYTNYMNYSTNGSNWTRVSRLPNPLSRSGACSWVYDGKMWIGGGRSGAVTYKNDVWYSTDGLTWTEATSSAAWSERDRAHAWVYNGKMWIGGGLGSGGVQDDMWYSTNGADWTEAT